jgi:hypothetical protein
VAGWLDDEIPPTPDHRDISHLVRHTRRPEFMRNIDFAALANLTHADGPGWPWMALDEMELLHRVDGAAAGIWQGKDFRVRCGIPRERS